MHEISWTNVSFHELLPGGMAERSLNQGNGFKSNEKKGKGSTSIKGGMRKLA